MVQRDITRLLAGVGAILVWIAIWAWLTRSGGPVPQLYFPAPDDVWAKFVRMWQRPYIGSTLLEHIGSSLYIVLFGWVVAAIVGIPLGIAMAWSKKLKWIVFPIFQLIRPVPPLAWIPLTIMWLGIGDTARMSVVFIAALVPWLMNSMLAVYSVDKLLIDAGKTLGASDRQILTRIVCRTALPTLVAAARMALGNAWSTLVAAEILAATAGLGYVAVNASQLLDTDVLIVAMITIGVLGIAMTYMIEWTQHILAPWSVKGDADMLERLFNRMGISGDHGLSIAYGTTSLSALLLLWFLSTSVFGWIEPRILPSPAQVVQQFIWIITVPFSSLTLDGHILSSLERWGWGVLVAGIIGIPVGIFFAWAPWFKTFVNPIFELLHFIPPFAYIPLAVLWFGASTATQAMVVFVAAFPAFVINAQLGVAQVEKIYVDAARVFGASQTATLRRVVIPAAAPSIYTGLRIAISNGWMALVGAELVVGKVGLGFMIAQGQENASVATIFVGLITIGVLGVTIDYLIQRSERYVLPWRKNVALNQG